ncbi:MAG: arsenate reductase ArsC [Candidatus Thermoplasmatota archaeon]|nr:arsenate reductase ArsC [Candidatus Thermoplasmatota archaeon]
MNKSKKRVLFLCTHNSARSQMAEGLLRSLYGDSYLVDSAGLVPTSINPYAIKVMKEIGIDITNQSSKSIENFRDEKFDYVVTVCDHAKEACPFFPGNKLIHKGFEDPSTFKDGEEEKIKSFRKIRDEIKDFIQIYFSN